MGEFAVDIQPDSSILGTYKNQSYKIESALAEFIDNSTQSFFSHKNELKKLGQNCCNINIEIYPEYIKIQDNAFGMEVNDFRRALKLDSPPEDRSGRNEKGMGLKTSATCLGSLWSVETTEYGSKNKYYAEVDVDNIVSHAPKEIMANREECNEQDHYTIIKIMMLNKKISTNKIASLIKTLAEIYALDIRNKDLVMTINKEPVKYERPALWVNQENGSSYMVDFSKEFTVNDKRYPFEGWIGIREKADTEFSGLTLFRKGRAIKIHYRPTKLLGKPNLYPYQRIIGEINLLGDNWEPSYTKDELMWEGDIEDRFIEEVKSAAKEIIDTSSTLRNRKTMSEKSQKQITNNINKLFQTVDSKQIDEIVNAKEKAGIDSVEEAEHPLEDVTSIKESQSKKVELDAMGTHYIFIVKYEDNDYDDWIKLKTINPPSEYELTINNGLPYFANFGKSIKNLEIIQKIAITISVSILIYKNNGNKDAYKILNTINAIVRSVK